MRIFVSVILLSVAAGLSAAEALSGPSASQDAQWGPDFRLTTNSYSDVTYWSGQRRIAKDGFGRIHVVWEAWNSALGTYMYQTYYKRFNPGLGWTQDTMISADLYAANTNNRYPALALDSAGRVHVVWCNISTSPAETTIYWKTCIPVGTGNGGWDSASTPVSTNASYQKECPNLAATPNGNVHLVWREIAPSAGQWQYIAYREWASPGGWQTQVNLESTSVYKVYPAVAGARDNSVHVVWHGYRPSGTGFYMVWYKGRGNLSTWGATESVSGGAARHQMYPSIAANPVTYEPHVLWQGANPVGTYRVLHTYRSTAGWRARDTVSETNITYAQGTGQIAFSADGTGQAVWAGYSAARPTVNELRYSERVSGVWSAPVNLTDTTGARDRPSITNGPGASTDLHLVWSDSRDGNSEIYYKQGVFDTIHDVAPTSIIVPAGNLDSGAIVTPACSLMNYGTVTETYSVRMTIGTFYDFTVPVVGHPVGARIRVAFPDWAVTQRGSWAVTCSTQLTTDQADSNDLIAGSCSVHVHDVGVVSITTPIGAISPGLIDPEVRVSNRGTDRESLGVVFAINTVPPYVSVLNLRSGLPLGDTVLQFAEWLAIPGNWVGRCSTGLVTEQLTGDDTASEAFSVSGPLDVAVSRIDAPVGTLDTSAPITPRAIVINNSQGTVTFGAWCRIDGRSGTVYQDSQVISHLGPGAWQAVNFGLWAKPHAADSYATRCSVYVPHDDNPNNDLLGNYFVVVATGIYHWFEAAPMPAAPSLRAVKDGGWLTYDAGTQRIYAAKGYKTPDFYSYDPTSDSWNTLQAIPDGIEAKKPGKGAVGCSDGYGVLYVTKGNNTQGFWKYDAVRDSWYQKRDVPLGTTGKKVKGGTDVAYVDKAGSGHVYLLKGYRNEFWRYDVAVDSWVSVPNAPPGVTGTRYDKGSWLAFDNTQTVLAHKAKYHELFAYDVAGESWLTRPLQGMPYIGRSGRRKKSKDGGSATLLNGDVYALKGGNTQEFWRFDLDGDSAWHESDTVPQFGSAGANKRVKAGGDLTTYTPGGKLYALKGNKTLELWQYVPGVLGEAPGARDGVSGVMARAMLSASSGMYVSPNPMRSGFVTIRLSGRLAEWSELPVRMSILDVTGRILKSTVYDTRSAITLDLRDLPSGVYLLQLRAGDRQASTRLVIQQ